MNKLYTSALSFAFAFMVQAVKAQEKPFGSMVFRSQIFDASHQAVKSQALTIEAELFTKDKIWYAENQQVSTTDEGFVFLQVGKGTVTYGNFSQVPFGTEEISLRIRYKISNPNSPAGVGFTELQATQLYAVPYAFHALTAGSLSGTSPGTVSGTQGNNTPGTDPDNGLASKGNTWSLYGNRYVSMRNGFLGTADEAPLNFKTNNKLRMSISADGKINFLGDVVLGNTNTLTVNNLIASSITTANSLTDHLNAGTAAITSDLQSSSPDTGALTVKGGTGIRKNLNVGETLSVKNNTDLSGNLHVAGVSDFSEKANFSKPISSSDLTESNALNEGSVIISGGMSVAKNINTGGNLTASKNLISHQDLLIDKNARIKGSDNATNKDHGALIIESGGLGVEQDIVSGGSIKANTNVTVDKDLEVAHHSQLNTVNITGTTSAEGPVSINNNTFSSTPVQGALVVKGGVGVGQNLNVSQHLNIGQNATVGGLLTTNSLAITNQMQVNGTDDAVDQNSGALVVKDGGLGVEKNIYSGKDITAVNNVTANNNLNALQNANVGQNLNIGVKTTTGSLNVNNAAIITGTADIAGITHINNAAHSAGISSGALVVAGGMGLAENLNIGQDLNVTKDTNLNGKLFTNKVSTFNDDALFNKQVSVNSNTDDDNSKAFEVKGGAIIGKRLHIKSTLSQTYGDFTNAALKVDGGAIINGNLSVLGQVFTQNATMNTLTPMSVDTYTYFKNPYQKPLLNNMGFGPDSSFNSYALRINAVDQGIAIRVNKHAESNYGSSYGAEDSQKATTGNNFISFWNKDGAMLGCIEGESLPEIVNFKKDYLRTVSDRNMEITKEANIAVFKGIEILLQAYEKSKAKKSTETAAGLNAITGSSPAGPIDGQATAASAAQTQKAGIETLAAAQILDKVAAYETDLGLSGAKIDAYDQQIDYIKSVAGVKYSSSAGDYAEYLELRDYKDTESIIPAQVVGVKGGKITLDTRDCEKVMVISMNPAVVGKEPLREQRSKFKPVAFMGQVPVFVLNETHIGDYILPSGNNDGYAIARSPEKMEVDDYKIIIGIAWGETNASKTVNVVVGINTNDVLAVVKQQKKQIGELEGRIERIEKYIMENNKNTAALFKAEPVFSRTETEKSMILIKIGQEVTEDQNIRKIVLKLAKELKAKKISLFRNRDLYIENAVNNYFGGIFMAREFKNTLTDKEKEYTTAYFKAITAQVEALL